MIASNAQQLLDTALDVLNSGEDWEAVLDALPVPVYTTGPDGAVTYWNRACVEFAGRTPDLGSDRWCVTWQLYTMAGDPLPHDKCPMAEAIRTRTAVRDEMAIALRPDGTRRAFRPYPTPLFDASGELTGAVNLLVDVSAEQAGALAEQSARCGRLSQSTTDARASRILADMAREYAATSAALRDAGRASQ